MSKAVMIKTKGMDQWTFYCPACRCDHYIQLAPNKPSWKWDGDEEKPTISPSILVRSGNEKGKTKCHFFVRNGVIEYCSDCTHTMSGKIVAMVPVDDM